jgi:hypothetical protein
MKFTSVLRLSAALALSSAGMMGFVPMSHAQKKTPAPALKLSAPYRAAAVPIETALKAKDIPTAP